MGFIIERLRSLISKDRTSPKIVCRENTEQNPKKIPPRTEIGDDGYTVSFSSGNIYYCLRNSDRWQLLQGGSSPFTEDRYLDQIFEEPEIIEDHLDNIVLLEQLRRI
ncbi:hypothetical protein JXA63_02005 [Candidatus Woesebacteria bacterium]|nr:hypothetical protein [Candidatus Woesebacteria bacterium]